MEAFQLRADGLGKIADQVGPALGDEDFNEAIEQMTIDMQDFLASDVLYARGARRSTRCSSRRGSTRTSRRASSIRVPGTEQPDLEWLDETAIQENLAAIAGNTAEPGLHDLAITSVLIDGVDVGPDTPATVAAENPPEVEVTIANEGDTEETDVEIAVAVSGGDEPITAEEVIPGSRRPSPGRQQSRSSLPRPPVRRSRSRSPWAPAGRGRPPTTSSATRSRSSRAAPDAASILRRWPTSPRRREPRR